MEYCTAVYTVDDFENLGEDIDSNASDHHPTNFSMNDGIPTNKLADPRERNRKLSNDLLNEQPHVPVLVSLSELDAIAKKYTSKIPFPNERKPHIGQYLTKLSRPYDKSVPVKRLNIHVEKYNRFKRVIDNKVSEDRIYTCHQCDMIFLRRSQIIAHLKLHERENFHCNYCRRGFVHKVSLNNHIKSHLDDRHECIPCDLCDQTFTKAANLAKHMNIHFNIRNYACNLCEKTFVDSSSLHKHTDTHYGVRYACDVCGKQYSARQTLRYHLAKHLGLEKPKQRQSFQCDVCGSPFPSKHLLEVHRNKTHLAVIFSCEVCSKTFSGKNNLNVHKKVHTTKFTCVVCDAKYSSREGMQVHMNKHMDVTFPCLLCSKVYYLERHLTDHVTKIHNF